MHKSVIPDYNKLSVIEIKSATRQTANIGHKLYAEEGLYFLESIIASGENSYLPTQLLVAKESNLCEFIIEAKSIIYIVGREPFAEGALLIISYLCYFSLRM